MSLHSADDTVRPDERPPPTEVGVLGWLRKNLFSTWPNAIITVVIVGLILVIVPELVRWAILDAHWTGADAQVCRDDWSGACWLFIREKFRLILFGLYPYAEQWRPTAATLILLAVVVSSCDRRRWNASLLPIWLIGLAIFGLLLFGGPLSLSTVLYLVAVIVPTLLMARKPSADQGPSQRVIWLTGLAIIAVVYALGQVTTILREIEIPTGMTFVPTASWGGLPLTFGLSVIGLATAFPFGILLALGRRSELPIIRSLCVTYIELIRGVPLITLLIMSSVLFPLFLPTGLNFDKLLRAQIALILFAAAYLAEVIRGGLQAIPKGQYEAADSLGLTYAQKTRLIILPQAIRISIPPLVNTFIGFFKDTALVIVIGLFDLLGAAKLATTDAAWRGFYKEPYLFIAIIYFAFCYSMSRYSQALERQMNVGTRRG